MENNTNTSFMKEAFDQATLSSDDGNFPVGAVLVKVIKLNVKKGDTVAESFTIATLESMKMEFEIRANKSGKVTSILVKEGDNINSGQSMVEWE
jgi:biotin carboxyl carrier protein